MFKLKKMVVLLVIVLLVATVCIQVKATDTTIDLDNLLSTDNTMNETDENAIENETQENEAVNDAGGAVIQPDTDKTTGSSENNLPQTGVTEDITVIFFIIVCVISAIYAYKKIRDYKA